MTPIFISLFCSQAFCQFLYQIPMKQHNLLLVYFFSSIVKDDIAHKLKNQLLLTPISSTHNREDICLQTLLLLFKYANHKNKRPFVSTANEALVGTLMTIGDVNNIFAIPKFRSVRTCMRIKTFLMYLSQDVYKHIVSKPSLHLLTDNDTVCRRS